MIYPPEVRAEAALLRRDGMTYAAIGVATGVKPATVASWFRPRPPRVKKGRRGWWKWNPRLRAQALRLRVRGLSCAEVREALQRNLPDQRLPLSTCQLWLRGTTSFHSLSRCDRQCDPGPPMSDALVGIEGAR